MNAGDNATPQFPVLGKIMAANFDDDNGDLLPDINNFGTQWEDNDLVPMHISWNEPGPAAGVPPSTSFTFIYPAPQDAGPGGKIIIWSDRKKTTRYASGQYYPTIPQNAYRPPSVVYVEGVATGPFTVSMHIAGHGFVCGSTSDQTFGFIAELKAYDLRSWTVQRNDAEQRLEITPLRPATAPSTAPPRLHPDSLANPTRVDGSATDGAAAVVMHLAAERPPASSMGEAFQIPPELKLVVTTLGSSNADDTSDRPGALFPSAPPFVELPMPIVPPTPAWSATLAGWGYDTFLYVPPDHCHAIPPDKQDIQIDVQLRTVAGDRVLCSWAYRLTRPPLVLCHGLWSSPEIWKDSQWSMTPTEPGWPAMLAPIYKIDYEASNAAGYDVNWSKIPVTINQAILDYREKRRPLGTFPTTSQYRFALCRVDYIGHSMGGVLARLFASDIGVNQSAVVSRNVGTDTATYDVFRLDRVSIPQRHYLSPRNNFAGAFHRFISIGSPLQGSPLSDPGIAIEKLKHVGEEINALNFHKIATGLRRAKKNIADAWDQSRAIRRNTMVPWTMPTLEDLRDEALEETLALIDIKVGTWRDKPLPYAVMDLDTNGAVLSHMNQAEYPVSARQVRWEAIVGIAADQAGGSRSATDEFQRAVWNGVFDVLAKRFAPAQSSLSEAFALCQDAKGDLVVTKWSQINKQVPRPAPGAPPPDFYALIAPESVFHATVHSLSAQSYPSFNGTVTAELDHSGIAWRCWLLLYSPPDPNLWQGDLK